MYGHWQIFECGTMHQEIMWNMSLTMRVASGLCFMVVATLDRSITPVLYI